MTTHYQTEEAFSKCGTFEITDEFVTDSETPECIECRFFDDVQALWEEYVSQPVNYGEDTEATRLAEHDAFFEGAFALVKKVIPF